MTDLEQRLRAAMHAAVDDEQPPRDLTARVIRRYRRRTVVLASATVTACALVAALVLAAVLGPPGAHHGAPPQPVKRLHGAPMPPGTGVRLMWSSRKPAWYSSSDARGVPISGLHRQDTAGYTLIRLPGGYAALPVGGRGLNLLPIYHIADNSKAATLIGHAGIAAPASVAGDVWLVDYPFRGPARAQLASLRGRPIGKAVTLPADRSEIVAGVGRYLLLTSPGANPGSSGELWSPVSRRVVRTFRQIDAADTSRVAWDRSCAGCPLHVFDARTGRTAIFAIPHGSRVVVGDDPRKFSAFSSDSTLLAVQLATGHDFRLAVIDLATGQLHVVPGVDLPVQDLGDYRFRDVGIFRFGWQPGTHRLQLALLDSSGPVVDFEVGYWQQGAARLRVATVPAPRGYVFDLQIP